MNIITTFLINDVYLNNKFLGILIISNPITRRICTQFNERNRIYVTKCRRSSTCCKIYTSRSKIQQNQRMISTTYLEYNTSIQKESIFFPFSTNIHILRIQHSNRLQFFPSTNVPFW